MLALKIDFWGRVPSDSLASCDYYVWGSGALLLAIIMFGVECLPTALLLAITMFGGRVPSDSLATCDPYSILLRILHFMLESFSDFLLHFLAKWRLLAALSVGVVN